MTNLEKYIQVFVEIFHVTEGEALVLEYRAIPSWDSVGHMGLIAGLEEAFDIMMDTDDIIELGSFEKGKELLKKYGVEF